MAKILDSCSDVILVNRDYRRLCLTNSGEKCFFHCWNNVSEIVSPSLLQGGHSGGVVSDTFAIMEFEDGSVRKLRCDQFIFIDGGKFKDYDWSYERKEKK